MAVLSEEFAFASSKAFFIVSLNFSFTSPAWFPTLSKYFDKVFLVAGNHEYHSDNNLEIVDAKIEEANNQKNNKENALNPIQLSSQSGLKMTIPVTIF